MPGPAFLTGDRVALHTIEEEDLSYLQRVVNDRRVWRPIGSPRPVNASQEREFFEDVVCSDDSIELLVVADDDPVGTVSLFDKDGHSGELGYWIDPDHHRSGYGSAAVRLLVDHGFDQLGLHRITARVYDFNDASQALLESLGFRQEGTARETGVADGVYRDTLWYAVLEDEWRSDE